ncbi:MAG: hypothetical protein ACJAUH_001947, partial [Saprospiraceae bacterium]
VSPENEIYEILEGGYGEGLNIAIKVGRKINENVDFELGIGYLFGRELTTTASFVSNLGTTAQFTDDQIFTRYVNGLLLSPQLVFNAPTDSKLIPYAKIGATFGCFMNVTDEIENTAIGGIAGVVTTKMTQKSKGNIATGLNATLGANYLLNEKFALYSELQLLNMAYSPQKTSLTSFVVNGNDQFEDLNTYQKETIYLDKVEYQDAIDTEKPLERLRLSLPMSNVRFNVGLRIDL